MLRANHCIEYISLCSKGFVRTKNQDNFWCNGIFLECQNEGTDKPIVGIDRCKKHPAFAVFDGMGGEENGELAAYIAATTFDGLYKSSDVKDIETFLNHSCFDMNDAICSFSSRQPFSSAGTTAAMLMFGKYSVYACNIGDSRIYRLRNSQLAQISLDHSETYATGRKPSLTQNLGIPPDEFHIEPYMTKSLYRSGDIYLACSDGLTDMLSDNEIATIILESDDVTSCGKLLMQRTLDAGGHDNITIIICKVKKTKGILNLFKVG